MIMRTNYSAKVDDHDFEVNVDDYDHIVMFVSGERVTINTFFETWEYMIVGEPNLYCNGCLSVYDGVVKSYKIVKGFSGAMYLPGAVVKALKILDYVIDIPRHLIANND